MTLFALPGRCRMPRASSATSRFGKFRPPMRASAPAFKVSRRVRPSQQRRKLPSMVIMGILPKGRSTQVSPTPKEMMSLDAALDPELPPFFLLAPDVRFHFLDLAGFQGRGALGPATWASPAHIVNLGGKFPQDLGDFTVQLNLRHHLLAAFLACLHVIPPGRVPATGAQSRGAILSW